MKERQADTGQHLSPSQPHEHMLRPYHGEMGRAEWRGLGAQRCCFKAHGHSITPSCLWNQYHGHFEGWRSWSTDTTCLLVPTLATSWWAPLAVGPMTPSSCFTGREYRREVLGRKNWGFQAGTGTHTQVLGGGDGWSQRRNL